MRVWLRSKWHRVWAGHAPDYYVVRGRLTGEPLVFCRKCDRLRDENFAATVRRYEG
jgi:hypothetical protein